jgi:ABC-type transporter Mla MlaB component
VDPPVSATLTFAVCGPISRDDLPALYHRFCVLLSTSPAHVAICDLRGAGEDAVTVDALARLQLAARRAGCELRLSKPSAELMTLVTFIGLEDVLPP